MVLNAPAVTNGSAFVSVQQGDSTTNEAGGQVVVIVVDEPEVVQRAAGGHDGVSSRVQEGDDQGRDEEVRKALRPAVVVMAMYQLQAISVVETMEE